MSQPIRERLRELEAEVQDLHVLPAAAVRARGRRRRRRQLAATAVGVVVMTTAVGIAATRTLERPRLPAGATPGPACNTALPDDPAAVRIRLVGGGAPAELVGATATQLRERRFTVQTGTGTGTATDRLAGTAAVRYGPAAIGAAALVRAELHGDAAMSFDPGRRDGTVDVVLGSAFGRLATTTEVNQALVTAGEPTAPPQCSTSPGR